MAKNMTKAKGEYRIRAAVVSSEMKDRVYVGYGNAFVGEKDAWKFETRTEADDAARCYTGVFVTLAAPV